MKSLVKPLVKSLVKPRVKSRVKSLPDYSDVVAAAKTIKGHAVRTPLLSSFVLDEMLGAKVLFKAECLQRTGSFKFRGAYNAITNLQEPILKSGIVACSSGNHAQGIAEAARMKGVNATIIMPSDAPESKKVRTRRSGATILEYDRHRQDRDAVTEQVATKLSAPIVHPYETFDVIAGQGTCALEFCEDLIRLGLVPDHVLVCAGGGGLLAGVTLATKHHFPNADIHPVEPDGYDDQARSHSAGERLGDNLNKPSICEAILTPMPGENSFAICKNVVSRGLVVTDEEALRAVAFAFHELKLVVEPGGAVALAALLAGKLDVTGKVVVATLSGGNIDGEILAKALAA